MSTRHFDQICSIIQYPLWTHYEITKPQTPQPQPLHSGPKCTPVKKLKLFFTVFIMSLPQKVTCDQKHAIYHMAQSVLLMPNPMIKKTEMFSHLIPHIPNI